MISAAAPWVPGDERHRSALRFLSSLQLQAPIAAEGVQPRRAAAEAAATAEAAEGLPGQAAYGASAAKAGAAGGSAAPVAAATRAAPGYAAGGAREEAALRFLGSLELGDTEVQRSGSPTRGAVERAAAPASTPSQLWHRTRWGNDLRTTAKLLEAVNSRGGAVHYGAPGAGNPFLVSSLRGWDEEQKLLERRRRDGGRQDTAQYSAVLDGANDDAGTLYSLREKLHIQHAASKVYQLSPSVEAAYDPDFLDDPEIRTGKSRTVVHFSGMVVSVIPYVKNKRLKDELNEQFNVKHAELRESGILHPGVTLSKIRRLKDLMYEVANHASLAKHDHTRTALQWDGSPLAWFSEFPPAQPGSAAEGWQLAPKQPLCSLELALSTIALGQIYMEKLVLCNVMRKKNRKLLAATCLLLALKFNEDLCEQKLGQENARAYDTVDVIELTCQAFGITRSQWRKAEVNVIIDLKFGLWVPQSDILKQIRKIRKRNLDDDDGAFLLMQQDAV